MPANLALMTGEGGPFGLVASCPVASEKYSGGSYMAHQGDPDSFLVADAQVRDGSAAVRLVLWRCAFCGTVCTGISHVTGDDPNQTVYTWLEEQVAVVPGNDLA